MGDDTAVAGVPTLPTRHESRFVEDSEEMVETPRQEVTVRGAN